MQAGGTEGGDELFSVGESHFMEAQTRVLLTTEDFSVFKRSKGF